MTTETKNITTTTGPQDTWDMASAVLVALNQTHLKAQAEYRMLLKAAEGKPFAPGVSSAGHLIETVRPALRQLEMDMRKHARSNSLAMPKLER